MILEFVRGHGYGGSERGTGLAYWADGLCTLVRTKTEEQAKKKRRIYFTLVMLNP